MGHGCIYTRGETRAPACPRLGLFGSGVRRDGLDGTWRLRTFWHMWDRLHWRLSKWQHCSPLAERLQCNSLRFNGNESCAEGLDLGQVEVVMDRLAFEKGGCMWLYIMLSMVSFECVGRERSWTIRTPVYYSTELNIVDNSPSLSGYRPTRKVCRKH